MQLLTNATRLDWKEWFVGIMGALISGGASAIGAFAGTTLVDPQNFNTAHPGKLLEVMTVSFLFSGIISVAKWLQLHPTPDVEPVASPQLPGKT